jgi:hypothetical protein
MSSLIPTDGENTETLNEEEPHLWYQTIELGKVLQDLSNRDPDGAPPAPVASVFRKWLLAASDISDEARYFDDVSDNFPIEKSSNRDLFDLFEMLHSYVEIDVPNESVAS